MTASAPRRVVVNDAIGLRGTSGSARATDQLARAMTLLENVHVGRVRPPWAKRSSSGLINAGRDAWWDLAGAARAARSPDLFVSPCNIGRASRRTPHLLVIYDVMVFEQPESFDPRFAQYFRALVPFSLRHATRVLTLSEHARKHLLSLQPDADIRVMTLPGREDPRPPVAWPARFEALTVGATEPHKNHASALEAVALLRSQTGADVHLRMIGPAARAEDDVRATMRRLDPDGTWTSRESGLSDADVDDAYGRAWLLLQPSLNEGYGLPLVEAAQRGLPVVHSGAGAMHEVLAVGDVKGTDPERLAAAMHRLLEPSVWAQESAAVAAEAPRFSWASYCAHIADLVTDLVNPRHDAGG